LLSISFSFFDILDSILIFRKRNKEDIFKLIEDLKWHKIIIFIMYYYETIFRKP